MATDKRSLSLAFAPAPFRVYDALLDLQLINVQGASVTCWEGSFLVTLAGRELPYRCAAAMITNA
eukprot:7173616-Pyramimonas_sp.AAC.1